LEGPGEFYEFVPGPDPITAILVSYLKGLFIRNLKKYVLLN
jgi:hypothetical protein